MNGIGNIGDQGGVVLGDLHDTTTEYSDIDVQGVCGKEVGQSNQCRHKDGTPALDRREVGRRE